MVLRALADQAFSRLGRLPILRHDATMPSPHADAQHRRKRQEAGKSKPPLCPVHIGPDGLDLIREEVSK